MERKLTRLEEGIIVNISEKEWKKLESDIPRGFLSRENYAPSFEKIALEKEVGRYLLFRFIKE